MKITRFVRIQLVIFAIVTVVAMVWVAVAYIKLPAMAGIGRYDVRLSLPSTGGLYQNANVAYRGVNVGKVKSVTLTEHGVQADLSVDSDAKIPASAHAAVRSVSAIGEQYVEFSPVADAHKNGNLHSGSHITSDDVPVEIASMLDQANALLDKVGDTKLRSLMNEAFDTFNGTGEDLRRLLDSLTLFVGDANRNVNSIIDLIRQAGPLLETQATTAGQIRDWTANVTKVTDQLRADNPEITDILRKGPGATDVTKQLFSSMNQTLPMMISNLGVFAKTMAVYLPNLRQVLVLYPRLMNSLISAVNSGDPRYGPSVDFSLGFQDPPPCTVGYLPKDQWRFPSAQNARDLPPGMLCRVSHDSSLAVRGGRNYPCAEFPGRRAPTPAECRAGYKPLSDRNPALPNGLPPLIPKPAGHVTPGTPSAHQPGPAVYATTYDPESGDFIGPDGKTYNAGTGKDAQGQDGTWQNLLAGAVSDK